MAQPGVPAKARRLDTEPVKVSGVRIVDYPCGHLSEGIPLTDSRLASAAGALVSVEK